MDNNKPIQKAPDMKAIMADYDKAVPFLNQVPAEVWVKLGEEQALKVFEDAAGTVSAYDDFLKKEKFKKSDVKTFEDFAKIPLMDKDNYYSKYSFNETNTVQAGKDLYSFALSSGTTGEPTLWPRYFAAEESAHVMFGLFMRLYWQIDKKKTLFINAANLGVYASGIFLNAAVKPLTQKYPITLATTGSDLDNIVHTVETLSEFYDQLVFVTYPTFMRTILDRLENSKIDLRKLNLKLFIGGEGHTVEWRRYMSETITGNPDDLMAIIDGYTLTETSISGFGTPLCNLVRQCCADNHELAEKLFGNKDIIPNLNQFNPKSVYIESVGNELVLTSNVNTPLIRYNIHDRGGVIGFRDMEKVLEEFDIDYEEELKKRGAPLETVWQQPFVYIFGRRDDTVIIGGGNIFPEQIEPIFFSIDQKEIHSMKLRIIPDEEQHQLFYVLLELKEDHDYSPEETKQLERKYHDMVLNRLMDVNADYAMSYRSDPKYCDPIVQIYNFGTGPFDGDLDRTKPRLIVR